MMINFKKIFFNSLPHHLISLISQWLSSIKIKKIKNWQINILQTKYQANLAEAEYTDIEQYPDFKSFFIRKLKPGLRTIESGLVSPVDGTISEFGLLSDNRLLQVKNSYFVVDALLTKYHPANHYYNGTFITFYLAPGDYHRVHMPIQGQLKKMIYVPGRLFPVRSWTVKQIPGLYSRNERVITIFETPLGEIAIILVGALNVGSVIVNWHGKVRASFKNKIQTWDYAKQSIMIEKGEELGYFDIGSTVIVLLPKGKVDWQDTLRSKDVVRYGQQLATLSNTESK